MTENTSSSNADNDYILSEITALEERAGALARNQRIWSSWWKSIDMWLGLAVAILSATAGVTTISSNRSQALVATLALSASVCGAILGFTRPLEKARKAEFLSILCEEFERRARYARTITLPDLSKAKAVALLSDLANHWEKIRWDDAKNQVEHKGLKPRSRNSGGSAAM